MANTLGWPDFSDARIYYEHQSAGDVFPGVYRRSGNLLVGRVGQYSASDGRSHKGHLLGSSNLWAGYYDSNGRYITLRYPQPVPADFKTSASRVQGFCKVLWIKFDMRTQKYVNGTYVVETLAESRKFVDAMYWDGVQQVWRDVTGRYIEPETGPKNLKTTNHAVISTVVSGDLHLRWLSSDKRFPNVSKGNGAGRDTGIAPKTLLGIGSKYTNRYGEIGDMAKGNPKGCWGYYYNSSTGQDAVNSTRPLFDWDPRVQAFVQRYEESKHAPVTVAKYPVTAAAGQAIDSSVQGSPSQVVHPAQKTPLHQDLGNSQLYTRAIHHEVDYPYVVKHIPTEAIVAKVDQLGNAFWAHDNAPAGYFLSHDHMVEPKFYQAEQLLSVQTISADKLSSYKGLLFLFDWANPNGFYKPDSRKETLATVYGTKEGTEWHDISWRRIEAPTKTSLIFSNEDVRKLVEFPFLLSTAVPEVRAQATAEGLRWIPHSKEYYDESKDKDRHIGRALTSRSRFDSMGDVKNGHHTGHYVLQPDRKNPIPNPHRFEWNPILSCFVEQKFWIAAGEEIRNVTWERALAT